MQPTVKVTSPWLLEIDSFNPYPFRACVYIGIKCILHIHIYIYIHYQHIHMGLIWLSLGKARAEVHSQHGGPGFNCFASRRKPTNTGPAVSGTSIESHPQATLDPQIFVKFLETHECSRTLTTPSLLATRLRHFAFASCHLRKTAPRDVTNAQSVGCRPPSWTPATRLDCRVPFGLWRFQHALSQAEVECRT